MASLLATTFRLRALGAEESVRVGEDETQVLGIALIIVDCLFLTCVPICIVAAVLVLVRRGKKIRTPQPMKIAGDGAKSFTKVTPTQAKTSSSPDKGEKIQIRSWAHNHE